MLTYDEALERILASISPLGTERLPLINSLGKVLAEGITAPLSLPPFDNSAMDGFAVRSQDTVEASARNPVELVVGETIQAGRKPSADVSEGQAAHIFTGAMMPPGADSVVPIEDVQESADRSRITLKDVVEIGAFVRNSGGDIRRGDSAIDIGALLTPANLALCSALGIADVHVYRASKIAAITTGDELVQPGNPLNPGQIYSSNGILLSAVAMRDTGQSACELHSRDSPESLRETLEKAIDWGADVIISSGGVSVGDFDFVKSVLQEDGRGKIDFWRTAIRPGKPFVFGQYAGALFFGLPGNPVSTYVTYELFVRPALRRLMGFAPGACARPVYDAVLTETVSHDPGRRSFQRAVTKFVSGHFETRALLGQGSHQLSILAQANSLLVIPEDVAQLDNGAPVNVILLDQN